MSTLESPIHLSDPRTGRPLDPVGEALMSLSDLELEREITIAAMEPRRRGERLDTLIKERQRRRSPS